MSNLLKNITLDRFIEVFAIVVLAIVTAGTLSATRELASSARDLAEESSSANRIDYRPYSIKKSDAEREWRRSKGVKLSKDEMNGIKKMLKEKTEKKGIRNF